MEKSMAFTLYIFKEVKVKELHLKMLHNIYISYTTNESIDHLFVQMPPC